MNGPRTIDQNLSSKCLQVTVIDTGVGINRADLKKLFTLFTFTKGIGDDITKGIGLGLTICKSII